MMRDTRPLKFSSCDFQFVQKPSDICFSVCAPFCPYNSKTITPISLKFGGQVFHGVQTGSSKFGVICLKIKARREFFLFLIGNTQ